ncbi:MAG: RNA polymerase Rpb4 family protein [Nitrososphaeria archaeon]|nr:RNA polymerase Rpb4 family protein [Aigarchaeota archaeon]MCX8187460.1 RNA polymerase Rpb4 family protein [Nitrososphaeria archaeon]MDW8021080.1 RNA polymerase Rpb4 family protein [Nitrososphaerota archaeon]
MARKIISRIPLSLPEVEKIMSSSENELNTLQLRVLNYVKKYSKLPVEKAEALVNELMEKFELTREEAVQIVDICPTHVEELRAILSGYKRLVSFLLFSEEKLQAIVDIVKRYLQETRS